MSANPTETCPHLVRSYLLPWLCIGTSTVWICMWNMQVSGSSFLTQGSRTNPSPCEPIPGEMLVGGVAAIQRKRGQIRSERDNKEDRWDDSGRLHRLLVHWLKTLERWVHREYVKWNNYPQQQHQGKQELKKDCSVQHIYQLVVSCMKEIYDQHLL